MVDVVLDARRQAALAAIMGHPDPVLDGLDVYVVGGRCAMRSWICRPATGTGW